MEYFFMGITIIVIFLMVALIGVIELEKEQQELIAKAMHLMSRNTENIDKDLRDINDRLKEIYKKMHI
jgi:hypothetical protein